MTARTILTPEQRAFLAGRRTAILATRGQDGRPRMVPICFVVSTDDRLGRPCLHSPLDEKPKRSADPHDLERVKDLLLLPDVSLLADRWSEDWTRLGWLRLHGRGELLEPEPREAAEHAAAIVALRAKYPQYATHRLEDRPILRLTIDRVTSWGDLSPG